MIINSYLPAPGMSIHFLPFPDRQNKRGNCIFNLFQVLVLLTTMPASKIIPMAAGMQKWRSISSIPQGTPMKARGMALMIITG